MDTKPGTKSLILGVLFYFIIGSDFYTTGRFLETLFSIYILSKATVLSAYYWKMKEELGFLLCSMYDSEYEI